jgi:hypothetical protein
MDLDFRELNVDLEMDWISLEWTLIGLFYFGFGLRSSSRFWYGESIIMDS